MTAYKLSLVKTMAEKAGLTLAQDPIPGLWSGAHEHYVGTQDLVLLRKP
jgi:hypothetical protein